MIHSKYQIFFLLLFIQALLTGQEAPLNTQLIAHVPFNENSSGMWGYVDANGLKYAVIGTASATRVFSLEDPAKPIERFVGPGAVGIWREVRYYKNYIYVSTDQGTDGLVVIDMNNAPENISYSFYKPVLTVGNATKKLERCHNIFIDEKGFCYLSGCNISNRGVLVFDLNLDPKEPPFVGYSDIHYSHDVYVSGDTMYNSEISNGLLSIYDVKDKSDIKLLTAFNTGRTFTHNAWTSDDKKYVFTTDERADAYVESYDISDFNNIKLLDRFRTLKTEGTGVIPHNTYYKNGYLITSYYTDGIRIIDAHKPDNLIEVAYFDTWNDPARCHNGFFGCWGVYPLDNESYVYGSDINNGLFIIKVDYKRACYLEGRVTDQNGIGVPNALIEILSDQLNRKLSGPSGIYRTGQVLHGTFNVKISHPDYLTQEVTVNLQNGEITHLDVQLVRKRPYYVVFNIKNMQGNDIVSNISLTGSTTNYSLKTDGSKPLTANVLSSAYYVFVSQWGYKNASTENFIVGEGSGNIANVVLEEGYEDNFENALGWTVISSPNMSGTWVRAIPRQTEYINGVIANPGNDSDDVGQFAFVTGNGIGGAGCDDVDNGTTTLISPAMDLSRYADPMLNYDVWYFNSGENSGINDTLVIKLTDGFDEVVVDKIYRNTSGWLPVRGVKVSDFIKPGSDMKLIVEASDQQGSFSNFVEAGFDHFFISDRSSSIKENILSKSKMSVYPNPVHETVQVRFNESPKNRSVPFTLYNAIGVPVMRGTFDSLASVLDVSILSSGIYLIEAEGFTATRFIKL